MRRLADRDADLRRARVSQLINDHRAASSPACADQAANVRLPRAAAPHLRDDRTRQDHFDRAMKRLIEDAEHKRRAPFPPTRGAARQAPLDSGLSVSAD